MKAKYPDFIIPGDTGISDQGTKTCLRDTYEYIIPAIVADLIIAVVIVILVYLRN